MNRNEKRQNDLIHRTQMAFLEKLFQTLHYSFSYFITNSFIITTFIFILRIPTINRSIQQKQQREQSVATKKKYKKKKSKFSIVNSKLCSYILIPESICKFLKTIIKLSLKRKKNEAITQRMTGENWAGKSEAGGAMPGLNKHVF